MKKRIVVQVVSCAKATSDVMTGIMRSAAEHPEWEIQLRGLHPSWLYPRLRVILPLSFLLLSLLGCSRAPSFERIEWTTMGTIAAFQYRPGGPTSVSCPPRSGEAVSRAGEDRATAEAEIVRRTFSEIEKLLNAHDPNSELRRLAPLRDEEILARCDKSVSNCYAAAFRLMRESQGVFNPRWRGAQTMDLGAIAKGFAVDEAVRALGGSISVSAALIDLGGNLRSVGGSWKVGVAGSSDVFVLTNGMSCATSGEYYRGAHIRDGRTGRAPTNGVYSVTVIHPSSAMLADGLTTTLFLLGREAGEKFLRTHYPEARAIWEKKGSDPLADPE